MAPCAPIYRRARASQDANMHLYNLLDINHIHKGDLASELFSLLQYSSLDIVQTVQSVEGSLRQEVVYDSVVCYVAFFGRESESK